MRSLYPLAAAAHVTQYAEGVFVWFDEAGLPGGAVSSLAEATRELQKYGYSLEGRPVPPAVAEFAVQMLDDLVERVRYTAKHLRCLEADSGYEPGDVIVLPEGPLEAFRLFDHKTGACTPVDFSRWRLVEKEYTLLRQPSAGVDERAHWFSLVTGCAADLEQAAISIHDEEAKRIANNGAKHYMKRANEVWQARAQLAAPAGVPDDRARIDALLTISRKILAKLQHPTASVHAGDMWNLEDALKPFDADAPSPTPGVRMCATMQRPVSECGCPDCGSSLIDCYDQSNEPCGGCGESNENKRCVGCCHDFKPAPASDVVPVPTIDPAHSDDVSAPRALLSKASAQIEHLAERLENVTEDDPEDGTSEALDEAREVSSSIRATLDGGRS